MVEDLGFCNHLYHSISTTIDNPVYLPQRALPQQLQHEMHECLDIWLRQGMIRPSSSPYASQVVIVKNKNRECQTLCRLSKIEFDACDAFPLLCINEGLQLVHNCRWFASIDLEQGYLQMPVKEEDMPKTAFRAG